MIRPQRRDATVRPAHVDQNWRVHTGRARVKVRPTAEMVGLKFGEFAKTRRSRPYTKKGTGRGVKT